MGLTYVRLYTAAKENASPDASAKLRHGVSWGCEPDWDWWVRRQLNVS